MVKVNGIEQDIAGLTIAKYLENQNYSLDYIAVEMNGGIVPKKQYEMVVLKDNDTIEVVRFVGGG